MLKNIALLFVALACCGFAQYSPPAGGACGSPNCTVSGNLTVSGTTTISTTIPTDAPTGSLGVGGSVYAEGSHLSGIVRTSPARVQMAWGPGTVNAGVCTTKTLPFPGVQKNAPVFLGKPTDFGAGLIATVNITGPDVAVVMVCNPTSGNVVAGTDNGWTITRN